MERDLTIICESIPTDSSGDVSTQASNIYKSLTGQKAQFDIQIGGDQPQLPNVTVQQKINQLFITASNDIGSYWHIKRNTLINNVKLEDDVEAFGHNFTYSYGAAEANQPYSITLSGEGFESSVVTGNLVYTPTPSTENGITFDASLLPSEMPLVGGEEVDRIVCVKAGTNASFGTGFTLGGQTYIDGSYLVVAIYRHTTHSWETISAGTAACILAPAGNTNYGGLQLYWMYTPQIYQSVIDAINVGDRLTSLPSPQFQGGLGAGTFTVYAKISYTRPSTQVTVTADNSSEVISNDPPSNVYYWDPSVNLGTRIWPSEPYDIVYTFLNYQS